MKNKRLLLFFLVAIWVVAVWKPAYSQTLDVSIQNVGGNTMQIVGTATVPGFTGLCACWGAMNISIRIPKSATSAMPPIVSEFPMASSVVTSESTTFTGVSMRDAFTHTLEISIFDKTSFGFPDDGNWYIQLSSDGGCQAISTGGSVVIYQFDLPDGWSCAGCVEILTTDVPDIPVSTTSFIDNVCSGNVLNIVTNNAPLPIELTFFDGASSKCDAALTWVTETEKNASHFEVQQSKDGRHFNPIGMVKAVGNSLSQQVYKYASAGGGNAYYRLRMVDADGWSDFSDVIFIKSEDCRVKDLVVYPNPSRVGENSIIAEVTLPQASGAKIYVLDAMGKIHALKVVNLDASVNKISIETDLLTPGMYWVRVELPNEEPLYKSFICQ